MMRMISVPERLLMRCIYLSVILIAADFLFTYYYFYHDDEMISLRYARNFIDGKGLIWNPGEQVEGYTNFLHLVFSSFFVKMFGDYLLAPRIVNFLFFLILIVGGSFIVRSKRISSNSPTIARQILLLVVLMYPGLYIWSYGALETVMFSSILFFAVSATIILGNNFFAGVLIGILFSLVSMTRPEGNILFFITAVYLFIRAWQEKKAVKVLGLIIAYMAIYGVFFTIRFNYYDALFPNTYYAKSNFSMHKLAQGVLYISRFLLSIIFVVACLLFLFRKVQKGRTRIDSRIVYLIVLLSIYSICIIMYGGDHMLGMRFCLPLLPLIGLLIIMLTDSYCFDQKSRVAVRVLLIVNGIYVCLLPINSFKMTRETDEAAAVGLQIGNYIDKNVSHEYLIASNSVGAVAFFAKKHKFIDMLGLCDSTIAKREVDDMTRTKFSWPGHEKGDGKYVLSRKPDIIILGSTDGDEATEPSLLSDVEIVADSRFAIEYEKKTVFVKTIDMAPGSIVRFKNAKVKDSLLFTYYLRRR